MRSLNFLAREFLLSRLILSVAILCCVAAGMCAGSNICDVRVLYLRCLRLHTSL